MQTSLQHSIAQVKERQIQVCLCKSPLCYPICWHAVVLQDPCFTAHRMDLLWGWTWCLRGKGCSPWWPSLADSRSRTDALRSCVLPWGLGLFSWPCWSSCVMLGELVDSGFSSVFVRLAFLRMTWDPCIWFGKVLSTDNCKWGSGGWGLKVLYKACCNAKHCEEMRSELCQTADKVVFRTGESFWP